MSTPGLSVENISTGGLFVRSSRPLPPGTPVMLQLVRPGLKRAIQATGRVVSALSPAEACERGVVAGMGIRLDDVDVDTQGRLCALIDELAAVAAAVRQPTGPRPPEPPPARTLEASLGDLTLVREAIAARDRRIQELEAELEALRGELLLQRN